MESLAGLHPWNDSKQATVDRHWRGSAVGSFLLPLKLGGPEGAVLFQHIATTCASQAFPWTNPRAAGPLQPQAAVSFEYSWAGNDSLIGATRRPRKSQLDPRCAPQ